MLHAITTTSQVISLVLDSGSLLFKAGFAGEAEPRAVFHSAVTRSTAFYSQQMLMRNRKPMVSNPGNTYISLNVV